MNRFATVDIETVLPLLGQEDKVELKGHEVNVRSCRLHCFSQSLTCTECGLTGKFFAIENHTDENPHLNLYTIDEEGNEILMTKDHIVPKSKGGSNHIDNLQTMCIECNEEKADEIRNN